MGLFDFIGEIFSSAMADTQRTMDKYDKKLSEYEKTHPGSEKAAEAREKLNVQREKLDGASRIRRTDSDFENSVSSDSERNPEDYSYKINVPLSEAKSTADNTTGVYVLYLDGRVMK